MVVTYYAEGDVIYVTMPDNDEYAITTDVGDDPHATVLLRRHPTTGRLVGVTIIDFVAVAQR